MQKRAAPSHSEKLLFFLILSLPLIYHPYNIELTTVLRSSAMMGVLVLIFGITQLRDLLVSNFKSFNIYIKLALGVIVVFATVSTVLTVNNDIANGIIGSSPTRMGLLFWFSALASSIVLCRSIVAIINDKMTVYILGGILTLSLLEVRSIDVGHERLAGLYLQAINAGYMAAAALFLSLQQVVNKSLRGREKALMYAVASVSSLVLLLSQSRIAMILAVLVLIFWAFKNTRKQYVLTLIISGVALLVLVAPSVFSRFQHEELVDGFSYRYDIYRVSIDDITTNNLLLGNGASTLPDYINDASKVPDDIAYDLKVGFKFASAHDFFIDVALFFGAVVGVIAVAFQLVWINRRIDFKNRQTQSFLVFYSMLLANALMNIQFAEITVLFVIAVGGLYYLPQKNH